MPKTSTTNKNTLIDATIKILDDAKGMDGLTVDALANKLKMSKSTLYKHFEGLDDLIYATIEQLCTQTDAELGEVFTASTPMDTFHDVASLYGRYAERMPVALFVQRSKIPAHARLRLENTEERLGERMFRAAMGTGASSYIAHGVRSAYEGVVRSTARTLSWEERAMPVAELTSMFRRSLQK